MANIISAISENPKYSAMEKPLQKVRDAVSGQDFVKAKGTDYLPSPAEVDANSPFNQSRYNKYLAGAEFDGFVGQTQNALVGKLDIDNMVAELPDGVGYLTTDIDADGTTIAGAIDEIARNVLAAKYHIGVADYQGVTDLDADQISIADLEQMDPRATIKFYARESLVDWDFQRINGRMQLSYMLLREVASTLDKESLQRTDTVSYVILALDDDGDYYQEKLTQVEGDGGYQRSERNYIEVDGVNLDYIPAFIFSDEELIGDSLPAELGMLSSLSDIAYNKYQVSADYKEAMRFLPPTTYVFGMDHKDFEQFKVVNGRDYVQTGAGCVNNMPGESSRVELIGANTEVQAYERYLASQDAKARAMGAVFETDMGGDTTATEAKINNANQLAVLTGLSMSVKQGMITLIGYCAMFEGIDDPDINIAIKTDFGLVRLSADEVRALLDLYREGVFDAEELAKHLKQGGWLVSEVNDLIGRLNTSGLLSTGISDTEI